MTQNELKQKYETTGGSEIYKLFQSKIWALILIFHIHIGPKTEMDNRYYSVEKREKRRRIGTVCIILDALYNSMDSSVNSAKLQTLQSCK